MHLNCVAVCLIANTCSDRNWSRIVGVMWVCVGKLITQSVNRVFIFSRHLHTCLSIALVILFNLFNIFFVNLTFVNDKKNGISIHSFGLIPVTKYQAHTSKHKHTQSHGVHNRVTICCSQQIKLFPMRFASCLPVWEKQRKNCRIIESYTLFSGHFWA